jgi:hypothetical protein
VGYEIPRALILSGWNRLCDFLHRDTNSGYSVGGGLRVCYDPEHPDDVYVPKTRAACGVFPLITGELKDCEAFREYRGIVCGLLIQL